MKVTYIMIILIGIIFGSGQSVFARSIVVADYKITINGEDKEINNMIVAIDDRTYLPLRDLAELLNLYIDWDEVNSIVEISDIGILNETGTATIFDKEIKSASPTDFKLKLNGCMKELANPIYAINDWSYLPLREIAEILDIEINWIEESRCVEIKYPIEEQSESIIRIPFEEDGLFGYTDECGEVVIEAKYRIAMPFSEDMAAVANDQYKFGYIDLEGNLVIPHKFYMAGKFSEGFAAIGVSDYEISEEDDIEFINFLLFNEPADSYYYIDKTGEPVFNKCFRQAGEFHDGIAPVTIVENYSPDIYNLGDYAAYIDRSGNILAEFPEVSEFKKGYAVVEDTIINKNMEVIFDGSEYDGFWINDSIITVLKNGKYGAVDIDNNIIIDFKYDYLSKYSDGLFVFEEDNKFGYIDINDNVIIPAIYVDADIFHSGNALVRPEDNNSIVFINKRGEYISEFIEAEEFVDKGNGLYMIYNNDKGQYINTIRSIKN